MLSAVGAATLARDPERKRLAFALIPLWFAAHQTIEGFIWLSISGGGPPEALVVAYLFFAQLFWPVYTPLAVLLMEEEKRRRWALYVLLAVGIVVAGTLGAVLIQNDYTVRVVKHSLQYATNHRFEDRMIGLYIVATTAPLLISRHRYVMAFGAVVLAGSFIANLAFYYAAASVWCFFAAIASVFVFLHIRRQARLITSEKPSQTALS